MHLGLKRTTAVLAMLMLAVPVWSKTYKQSLTLSTDETIGSTKLQAGPYDFNADDTKKELNVLQNGKVVATVPGGWVKLPNKAPYSTYLADGNKITQVQFSGIDQAFQPQ